MIDLVQIENALNRINGDIFQEFCNHFLYLKLNPNTITPIGSVLGKEKSRKGIPDSYFTSADNELIFAEYTTRERLKKGEGFFNKLIADIENCFDTSKTGLKKEEIDKVILCFTERIKPVEKKSLEKLCKKHNPKCILDLKGIRDLAFAVLDYPILGTYVGIKVGTGQIQEPSEFIANYEKNKISTPLSNIFFARVKELKDGLKHLETYDLLLIHGAPGTGKSKFAIELAKLYSDKNDFSFLCIGNKGIPIWEDLKTIVRIDKKYVLLVDDANRLAKNFQWILSLFEERFSKTLKVIVTVRDYALPQVKSIAVNYDSVSLEIGAFSNDEIKNIIQSDDFKINEPSYVDRILKIAQGNARLAIMCAKVALKAKNILELNDASRIYDEYFEPLFKEVEILKEPIAQKSLALISFFSRIDRENRELCDFIFKSLEVEENKFWEICYTLHESELVDLFEQQVVKISDQIFSTYIFYKAVIENETLSFNFFLNNYLDYENRITDTIVPVINTFNYKHIEKKLKPLILKKWLDIEQQGENHNSLKYLDLFWFYLSPQVINFLKKQIDNQEAKSTIEYRYSYELNEFSYGSGKDLEILSRFRYHSDELFRDALELMFYYAIKVPSKMPAVIYTLKEKFSFSRLGYIHGDRIQHILFDFLFAKCSNNDNKTIYENVLTETLPSFLKLEYRENEGNGRAITIYTFHLWLSDSIKSFRTKCFNYLLQTVNKSIVLQILYRLNYYEYKHSDDILKHDLHFIYQIINKYFSPEEFEDCFVLQNVLEGLDWLKVDYSNEIKSEYNSKLYQLAEVLKRDRKR
ncbi:MAG: ATP-binding protein, partial [Ignavibacteriae bacterium]|nr:ATP-binding protein [Ignavibacteriota bacterium]